MIRLLLLSLVAVSTLTLAGCSAARYVTHPSSNANDPGNGGSAVDVTKDFETKVILQTATPPPVDLVWVIDNSGSMAEEAAHVRNNFQTFIDTVGVEADLKIALISRMGTTGTNVTLPITGPSTVQLNRVVWSTDSLEVLSSAFCPSPAAVGGACQAVRNRGGVNDIAGQLSGFLRTGSKKAFIFVTDDESRMPAPMFTAAFDESYPGEKPDYYGFVGLDTTQSPCMDSAGTSYIDLARSSGGTAFNICDNDWTQAFEKLAINVIRLAHPPVIVPADLQGAEIISVTLNGTALASKDYTLTKDGLYIDPALTKNLGEVTVHVRYKLP